MWHGAEWNFIAWGAFYGILLIVEKYLLKDIIEKTPMFIRHVITMVVVMIGWVFFSSADIGAAFNYLAAMFCLSGNAFFDSEASYLILNNGFAIVLMCLSAFGFFAKMPKIKNEKVFMVLNRLMYVGILILCVAYLISETYNPFLYFRF